MLPKISVITPSFNQAEFIEETIVSVIGQDYPNLEYIVIDGGSTDGTVDIIRKYEKHITYWISEPDSGQTEALNKGLRLATGNIFGWLNSDDVYARHALREASKSFDSEDVRLVYGNCFFIDEKGQITKFKKEIRYSSIALWSGFNVIPQPASFYSINCLREIGFFNESLKCVMDYEYNLRLDAKKCGIHYNPNIFAFFRWHRMSKSTDRNHENLFDKEKSVLLTQKHSQSSPFPKLFRKQCEKLAYHSFRLERYLLSIPLMLRYRLLMGKLPHYRLWNNQSAKKKPIT